MSRGSPVVQVRIPEDLLKSIDSVIERVNERRYEEPMTRSRFVQDACREKLSKMERSRKQRASRVVLALVEPADQVLDAPAAAALEPTEATANSVHVAPSAQDTPA